MKKKIILSLLFVCSALYVNAQEWQTDFEQAKDMATKENQTIILVFQGSDWCAPCMKLDREIWSSAAFKAYAKEHFVMLKADFPRKSKNTLSPKQQEANNHLASLYNKNGFFPHVVVLDKTGKLLGKTGYKKTTPSEYIKILESFKN
jgi:thioredoxin-related protein